MVFIPKEHYEKLEKQQEISQKVEAKKTLNKINEEAQGPKDKLDQKNIFKLIKSQHKNTVEKPKQVSIKDIERELKIQELCEEKKQEQIEELLKEQETREIKNEIIDVLAIAHTHPDKNKLFKHKLGTSETINKYVDDNVLFRFFNKANSHLKFGTIYTIKYLQTHREYNQYVSNMVKLQKQQEQMQEKAKEEKPEEPEEKNAPEE